MNDKTTYEVTIAESLPTLSLPGMEDAIWKRVKAQLDFELPTNDGPSQGPETPTGSGWQWSVGSFVFVVALVSIFFLAKKPNRTTQPVPIQTIQNGPTSLSPQPKTNDTLQTIQRRTNKLPVVAPQSISANSPISIKDDSLTTFPSVASALPDTLQQTLLPSLSSIRRDSIAPQKKTRGVSGISDSDYRITPKRSDSL